MTRSPISRDKVIGLLHMFSNENNQDRTKLIGTLKEVRVWQTATTEVGEVRETLQGQRYLHEYATWHVTVTCEQALPLILPWTAWRE